MRLYLLQIHDTSNCLKLDELFHFEDFKDLCAEFTNKMRYYTARDCTLCSIEEPTLDEGDNEVGGLFRFYKKTGDVVIGRVADVHIGD